MDRGLTGAARRTPGPYPSVQVKVSGDKPRLSCSSNRATGTVPCDDRPVGEVSAGSTGRRGAAMGLVIRKITYRSSTRRRASAARSGPRCGVATRQLAEQCPQGQGRRSLAGFPLARSPHADRRADLHRGRRRRPLPVPTPRSAARRDRSFRRPSPISQRWLWPTTGSGSSRCMWSVMIRKVGTRWRPVRRALVRGGCGTCRRGGPRCGGPLADAGQDCAASVLPADPGRRPGDMCRLHGGPWSRDVDPGRSKLETGTTGGRSSSTWSGAMSPAVTAGRVVVIAFRRGTRHGCRGGVQPAGDAQRRPLPDLYAGRLWPCGFGGCGRPATRGDGGAGRRGGQWLQWIAEPLVLSRVASLRWAVPEDEVPFVLNRMILDDAGGSEDLLDWAHTSPAWPAMDADLGHRFRGLEFVHRWVCIGRFRSPASASADATVPIAFDLRRPQVLTSRVIARLGRLHAGRGARVAARARTDGARWPGPWTGPLGSDARPGRVAA